MPPRNPDPNAEVNLLRKESDRMRRENKNLHQTLKAQSSQIEELEKKLKRKTEHMRVGELAFPINTVRFRIPSKAGKRRKHSRKN